MNTLFLRFFALVFALAGFAFSGCADEKLQKPSLTTNTQADPDNTGPALWMLKDADTTIYLFGTVHILKPGTKWQSETFTNAFAASDILYQETNIDDAAMQRLAQILPRLAFYSDGQTLRGILNAEDKTSVVKLANKLGLPLATLDSLKPWFASISLSQMHLVRNGYRTDSGVERVLSKLAKEQDKPLRYLETGEQQLHFLADLPQDSQISFLVTTAKSIEEQPEMLDHMVASWAKGDMSVIAALLSDASNLGDAHVYDTLLVNRNQVWSREIIDLMEREAGTFMFAVGAAHLAGGDSVITMLTQEGKLVTRQ